MAKRTLALVEVSERWSSKIVALANRLGFGISRWNKITEAAVKRSGTRDLVGYGVVNVLAEATMVLDPNASLKERILTMKMLMDRAVFFTELENVMQLHVFVKDPKLVKILKKHYGFMECSGTALVKNLG